MGEKMTIITSAFNLPELPDELILEILSNLTDTELKIIHLVNKRLNAVVGDRPCWKEQCRKDWSITVKARNKSWRTTYQNRWKQVDCVIEQGTAGELSFTASLFSASTFKEYKLSPAHRKIIGIYQKKEEGTFSLVHFTFNKVQAFCKSRNLPFDKLLKDYYFPVEIKDGFTTFYQPNLLSSEELQRQPDEVRGIIASFFVNLQLTSKEEFT